MIEEIVIVTMLRTEGRLPSLGVLVTMNCKDDKNDNTPKTKIMQKLAQVHACVCVYV